MWVFTTSLASVARKASRMPTPTSRYTTVKSLPASVSGVKSPYPTVVSVTTLK
jgi:hypothetical protein